VAFLSEIKMKSIWQPYVKSAKDDWTGVTDPTKRKRIQDRLAQRARRKFLSPTQLGYSQKLIR
jgi:hypothetical protein